MFFVAMPQRTMPRADTEVRRHQASLDMALLYPRAVEGKRLWRWPTGHRALMSTWARVSASISIMIVRL